MLYSCTHMATVDVKGLTCADGCPAYSTYIVETVTIKLTLIVDARCFCGSRLSFSFSCRCQLRLDSAIDNFNPQGWVYWAQKLTHSSKACIISAIVPKFIESHLDSGTSEMSCSNTDRQTNRQTQIGLDNPNIIQQRYEDKD